VGGLVAALAADPDAMILAGGHSLLPALALRGQRSGRLVDIGRIAALKRIELDGGAATIGAGVTLSAILASPVAAVFPALAQALRFVGNHVVRNRATIGGCLAWADPRGEVPLILAAHDATVVTSRRTIAAEQLVTGPFATMLEPGEAILETHIPPPPVLAFDEVLGRNSTGRAILSAACAVLADGSVRLSLGGLVDRPVRSAALPCVDADALDGLSAGFVAEMLAQYPALPDASAIDYRRTIAPRLLRRCYLRAVAA
jgi:CO/xanthine dehydrogenase FAD-binding subunit